jgi:hypothetical protein
MACTPPEWRETKALQRAKSSPRALKPHSLDHLQVHYIPTTALFRSMVDATLMVGVSQNVQRAIGRLLVQSLAPPSEEPSGEQETYPYLPTADSVLGNLMCV